MNTGMATTPAGTTTSDLPGCADQDDSSMEIPKPSPYLLARRRCAFSNGGTSESVYRSRPRMKRRGAISYDRADTAAEYIRYLGEYFSSRRECTVLVRGVFFLSKRKGFSVTVSSHV